MPEWFKDVLMFLALYLLASIVLEVKGEFVSFCRESLLAGGRFLRGVCVSVSDLWHEGRT